MSQYESYVLLSGTHRGPAVDKEGKFTGERKVYNKGDIVPLTKAQYAAFTDKFKPYAVIKAEQDAAEADRKRIIAQQEAITKAEEQSAAAAQKRADDEVKKQAETAAAAAAKNAADAKAEGATGTAPAANAPAANVKPASAQGSGIKAPQV